MLLYNTYFFFLMIRRPPRSTLDRSSAASDVYKRQHKIYEEILYLKAIAFKDELKSLQSANILAALVKICLLYTSPSPRDRTRSRMPSSA